MFQKHRKIFWPLLILLMLGCGAVYTYTRKSNAASIPKITSRPPQHFGGQPTFARKGYVRRAALSARLRENLNALGDRLEKPGKERLMLTGTLMRAGDAQTEGVTAVLEFPNRVRLTIQRGVERQIVTLNEGRIRDLSGNLSTNSRDLIETLAYDTAEHFFAGQKQTMATRFLGSHFRTDDGKQPNYSGPFYDLYQTTETLSQNNAEYQQTKIYCFNSETGLLERVAYRSPDQTSIEVLISGWQEFQGQRTPTRIERLVNGTPVLTLIVSSANVTPKIDNEFN